MSSKEVNIIATLYPAPGKIDQAIELVNGMAEWVKQNEPGTIKYHLHRVNNKKTGREELIMLESYADMEAVKKHGASSEFKRMGKIMQEEGVVTAPTNIQFVKVAGGFASRL